MLDFAIFAVTFVVILVGAVLYLYPSSRQISGVPGLNPTEEKDGNLQDIVSRGSLHEFLVGLHDRFGSVASFWFGRRPVVSLGSVDELRQHINPNWTTDSFETMLKSLLGYQSGAGQGAMDAVMRKKVYEGAINKTLDNNFHLLIKLVEELVEKWQSYPKSQHIPICAHLLGLSMKVVTQLAMGRRFADDSQVLRFRKNHEAIWSEIGKGYLDGSLDKSPSRKAHYEGALAEMESMLKTVIKERSECDSSQSAFIDSLLQAKLSEKQVMEESMVFTLAGCVITANYSRPADIPGWVPLRTMIVVIYIGIAGFLITAQVMTFGGLSEHPVQKLWRPLQEQQKGCLCIWAVHFLSISEAVQEKLHKELSEVLENNSLDKISQLSYCQQVLNETVRTAKLTPIAARLQEVEGKVNSHVIPKETLVIYALGVVLQDPDTWPLPYRFDPDRFTDASVKKSFSLLGFSGNQTCPELRFAYTVATVLLSTLVRRLRVHRIEGQVMEARYELVSTPKDDTWITVSKRN